MLLGSDLKNIGRICKKWVNRIEVGLLILKAGLHLLSATGLHDSCTFLAL